MAAPTSIQVDMLIRRMYGLDVSRNELDDLRRLDARQLGVIRDLILERLGAPGPVDKDALKEEIRRDLARLLTP
jgi:ribosomal protein L29